jgi:hypothetical protein
MAGMVGLGGPEIAAILVLFSILVAVPILVVVLIVKVVRRPAQFSRYCPKCGRGLSQQADAPFCGYCGDRLP